MKKFILSSTLLLAANLYSSADSFAQCAVDLPNQLEACFNSLSPGALTVTVSGSNLYITGVIDPSLRDQAEICLNQYNLNAASCPGAPVVVYSTPPPSNYDGTNVSTNLSGLNFERLVNGNKSAK